MSSESPGSGSQQDQAHDFRNHAPSGPDGGRHTHPDASASVQFRSLGLEPPDHRTLLLGLGNDLLSDDAIGLRVVAEAERLAGQQPGLVCVTTAEIGLGLLDIIIGFKSLVIVDAIQTGQAPPGFVHELALDDLRRLPIRSPHFLGIAELLALGRELSLDVPERITIFAVEVQDPFTIGYEMTPALRAALPRAAALVLARIQDAAIDQPVQAGASPIQSSAPSAVPAWSAAAR